MFTLGKAYTKLRKKILNVSWLVVQVIVLLALIAGLLVDVLYACSQLPTEDVSKYLTASLGVVALICLASFVIISSRRWSSVSALNEIPRLYIPISVSDIPMTVAKVIRDELMRSYYLLKRAVPKADDSPVEGWGQTVATNVAPRSANLQESHVSADHPLAHSPSLTGKSTHRGRVKRGSSSPVYTGRQPSVQYKDASAQESEPISYIDSVFQTVALLENKAKQLSPSLERKPTMTLREYVHFLAENGVWDRPDIAFHFVQRYERLRYGAIECNVFQYQEIMKLSALVLRR